MFIKKNPFDNDSLIKEAKGLELLKQYINESSNYNLKIPKIYSCTKHELKLENINHKNASESQMKDFAIGLASLHKIRFDKFGLDYDNFIGLSIQKNTITDNWGEFFFSYRLLSQLESIKDISIKEIFFEQLYEEKEKLVDFLNSNIKYASILHGDLWAGNVLFSESIYLIDPAVYFGDKEVDLAMTEMFGGFTNNFYNEYKKQLSVSSNYETKKIIYNFYHYLNHYNLFWDSYINPCFNALKIIQKI